MARKSSLRRAQRERRTGVFRVQRRFGVCLARARHDRYGMLCRRRFVRQRAGLASDGRRRLQFDLYDLGLCQHFYDTAPAGG